MILERQSQLMKLLIAMFGSLVLLAVAAFCLFGFLATFEPTTNSVQFMAFRIGYAVVGLASVVGGGLLIAYASRR
jgi:hypothetical protein